MKTRRPAYVSDFGHSVDGQLRDPSWRSADRNAGDACEPNRAVPMSSGLRAPSPARSRWSATSTRPVRDGPCSANLENGGHLDMFYGCVAVAKPAIDSRGREGLRGDRRRRFRHAARRVDLQGSRRPALRAGELIRAVGAERHPGEIVVRLRQETALALTMPACTTLLAA
jgi:hypothetical protein